MTNEGLQAVVTSPPFGAGETRDRSPVSPGHVADCINRAYTQDRQGSTPGNLAHMEAGEEGLEDDFWTAARAIVDQCHLLLKPGAVAAWIVKRFVRDKQIVDFPDQWRQMCEAAGFETVEWIRAWVVEEHGTQMEMFGNHQDRKVERKSFFRRLYESKFPENSIDWEDVIIMRKLEA